MCLITQLLMKQNLPCQIQLEPDDQIEAGKDMIISGISIRFLGAAVKHRSRHSHPNLGISLVEASHMQPPIPCHIQIRLIFPAVFFRFQVL